MVQSQPLDPLLVWPVGPLGWSRCLGWQLAAKWMGELVQWPVAVWSTRFLPDLIFVNSHAPAGREQGELYVIPSVFDNQLATA